MKAGWQYIVNQHNKLKSYIGYGYTQIDNAVKPCQVTDWFSFLQLWCDTATQVKPKNKTSCQLHSKHKGLKKDPNTKNNSMPGFLLSTQLLQQVPFVCSEVKSGEKLPGNSGVCNFSCETLLWSFISERSAVLFVLHQTSITFSTHRLILVRSTDHFHLWHRQTILATILHRKRGMCFTTELVIWPVPISFSIITKTLKWSCYNINCNRLLVKPSHTNNGNVRGLTYSRLFSGLPPHLLLCPYPLGVGSFFVTLHADGVELHHALR